MSDWTNAPHLVFLPMDELRDFSGGVLPHLPHRHTPYLPNSQPIRGEHSAGVAAAIAHQHVPILLPIDEHRTHRFTSGPPTLQRSAGVAAAIARRQDDHEYDVLSATYKGTPRQLRSDPPLPQYGPHQHYEHDEIPVRGMPQRTQEWLYAPAPVSEPTLPTPHGTQVMEEDRKRGYRSHRDDPPPGSGIQIRSPLKGDPKAQPRFVVERWDTRRDLEVAGLSQKKGGDGAGKYWNELFGPATLFSSRNRAGNNFYAEEIMRNDLHNPARERDEADPTQRTGRHVHDDYGIPLQKLADPELVRLYGKYGEDEFVPGTRLPVRPGTDGLNKSNWDSFQPITYYRYEIDVTDMMMQEMYSLAPKSKEGMDTFLAGHSIGAGNVMNFLPAHKDTLRVGERGSDGLGGDWPVGSMDELYSENQYDYMKGGTSENVTGEDLLLEKYLLGPIEEMARLEGWTSERFIERVGEVRLQARDYLANLPRWNGEIIVDIGSAPEEMDKPREERMIQPWRVKLTGTRVIDNQGRDIHTLSDMMQMPVSEKGGRLSRERGAAAAVSAKSGLKPEARAHERVLAFNADMAELGGPQVSEEVDARKARRRFLSGRRNADTIQHSMGRKKKGGDGRKYEHAHTGRQQKASRDVFFHDTFESRGGVGRFDGVQDMRVWSLRPSIHTLVGRFDGL